MRGLRWLQLIVVTCLGGLLLLSSGQAVAIAQQSTTINLMVNQTRVMLDQQPMIVQNTIYLPLRKLLEIHGADIHWDQEKQTIRAERPGRTIIYALSTNQLYVNGVEKTFAEPVIAAQNQTYLPIKLLTLMFDSSVWWEPSTKTVHIKTVSWNSFLPDDPENVPVIPLQPVEMKGSVTSTKRSIVIEDILNGASISVEHYGVKNDKLYTFIRFLNYSGKDNVISFEPGNKKITWEDKKKLSNNVNVFDYCEGITTSESTTGVQQTPQYTNLYECIKQNSIKLKGTRDGSTVYITNRKIFRSEIQASDGSLQEFKWLSSEQETLYIEAPLNGESSFTLQGSYKALNEEGQKKTFTLYFDTSQELDLGSNHY